MAMTSKYDILFEQVSMLSADQLEETLSAYESQRKEVLLPWRPGSVPDQLKTRPYRFKIHLCVLFGCNLPDR